MKLKWKIKMFKKYKNRPMIINAIQMTDKNVEELERIVINGYYDRERMVLRFENKLHNSTLELRFGEWLIKGSYPGDYYPCKNEVFREKYSEIQTIFPLREGKEIKGGINEPPTTPRPAPPKGQSPLKIDLKKVGKDLVDAVRKEKDFSMGYQQNKPCSDEPPKGPSGVQKLSVNDVEKMLEKGRKQINVITPEDIEKAIGVVEKYGRMISLNNNEVKKKTIPFSKYIELQVIYKTTNNLSNENVKMVIDEILELNNCEVE